MFVEPPAIDSLAIVAYTADLPNLNPFTSKDSAMSESSTLDFDTLKNAVQSAAAFRCRRRLQPAGGPGDKVFPPTFAGAVYACEKRRLPGYQEPVLCVLLDSVQSQANRMEQALQDAIDEGKLTLPHVVVDFSDVDPIDDESHPPEDQNNRLIDRVGKVTSLQAPHRLADAILRDSEWGSPRKPFRQSDAGKQLNQVSASYATPIFELSPHSLLFGLWDSTGPKGGLGPKFERAIVSEIVGINVEIGDLRRGVRRDPLGIRKTVKVVADPEQPVGWRIAQARDKSINPPSKINHSSVPFPEQRDKKTDKNYFDGVTIEYAEQIITLSLIVLRRLHFPLSATDSPKPEVDLAARTVLAALGLTAATLAFESGIALRSRCLLWPDGPMIWELLEHPRELPKSFSLSSNEAIKLLHRAVANARELNIPWPEQPLVLKPSSQLLELVRLSQLEATKEEAGTTGD